MQTFFSVWRIRDVYPGSRILIFTHPGSRIPDLGSRIPDPKTATKDRGEKKIFVKPFFVATNFTKLNIILFLICWRKNFGPIFQELLKFLPKKLSPSRQKYGFGIRDPGSEIRDPRSGIRKNPFPVPGSRGQKGTGSRILDPDPQHCFFSHYVSLYCRDDIRS
jgi:hypothetical protein